MVCKVCFSATRKEYGNYVCNHVMKWKMWIYGENTLHHIRYVLKLKVSDEMATTTSIMFNEVAQRLLGSICASTLLEKHYGFTNTIPTVIQDLTY